MRVLNSLLIFAILLFAAAMTWTYFAVRGDSSATPTQIGVGGGPDNMPNYRMQFSTLLAEHGNLAATHLSDLYDGKDVSDTSNSLDTNAQKLASLIGKFGTTTDKETFLETFRGHITEYERYTMGLKDNTQAEKNIAKENLQMHAMSFGTLINKLMPSISVERGTELMNEHARLTLAIIDAHAKGDTAAKLNAMKNANTQALAFAGELAKGAEQTSNRN